MKKGKIHLLFCFFGPPRNQGRLLTLACVALYHQLGHDKRASLYNTHTHREIAFTHNNTQTFSNSSGTNNAPMSSL
jgi:hypothetical protein